jgi:hypothetical protein
VLDYRRGLSNNRLISPLSDAAERLRHVWHTCVCVFVALCIEIYGVLVSQEHLVIALDV